jgi:diguanylate cyclase (GGDEF)-like protein
MLSYISDVPLQEINEGIYSVSDSSLRVLVARYVLSKNVDFKTASRIMLEKGEEGLRALPTRENKLIIKASLTKDELQKYKAKNKRPPNLPSDMEILKDVRDYNKMCKQSIDAFTVSNKSMSKAILAQGDYLDSIQTEAPDGIHIDYQKIISSMLSFQGQLLEELRRSDGHIRKLETDLEQALGESRYDPLTKLLNKKAFMSDVDSILQKASTQKSDLSVAYIKIGKFQDISAKLGYLAGDKVLIFLSNTLKSILANDKRIYRVGEDEILVLIDDTFNEKPLEIAKKIISKIELSKLVYSEQPLKINVAIGMAKFNHDDDYISLIERASKALAMAKEAGGNFVKEFII